MFHKVPGTKKNWSHTVMGGCTVDLLGPWTNNHRGQVWDLHFFLNLTLQAVICQHLFHFIFCQNIMQALVIIICKFVFTKTNCLSNHNQYSNHFVNVTRLVVMHLNTYSITFITIRTGENNVWGLIISLCNTLIVIVNFSSSIRISHSLDFAMSLGIWFPVKKLHPHYRRALLKCFLMLPLCQ